MSVCERENVGPSVYVVTAGTFWGSGELLQAEMDRTGDFIQVLRECICSLAAHLKFFWKLIHWTILIILIREWKGKPQNGRRYL